MGVSAARLVITLPGSCGVTCMFSTRMKVSGRPEHHCHHNHRESGKLPSASGSHGHICVCSRCVLPLFSQYRASQLGVKKHAAIPPKHKWMQTNDACDLGFHSVVLPLTCSRKRTSMSFHGPGLLSVKTYHTQLHPQVQWSCRRVASIPSNLLPSWVGQAWCFMSANAACIHVTWGFGGPYLQARHVCLSGVARQCGHCREVTSEVSLQNFCRSKQISEKLTLYPQKAARKVWRKSSGHFHTHFLWKEDKKFPWSSLPGWSAFGFSVVSIRNEVRCEGQAGHCFVEQHPPTKDMHGLHIRLVRLSAQRRGTHAANHEPPTTPALPKESCSSFHAVLQWPQAFIILLCVLSISSTLLRALAARAIARACWVQGLPHPACNHVQLRLGSWSHHFWCRDIQAPEGPPKLNSSDSSFLMVKCPEGHLHVLWSLPAEHSSKEVLSCTSHFKSGSISTHSWAVASHLGLF